MIVVSDASPLISLAAIHRLDLLRQLYGTIWVPESVFREVAEAHPERQGAQEIRQADWIAARPVGDSVLVRALKGELDLGEAEAIALAVELEGRPSPGRRALGTKSCRSSRRPRDRDSGRLDRG